jgi:hypothetical protein
MRERWGDFVLALVDDGSRRKRRAAKNTWKGSDAAHYF